MPRVVFIGLEVLVWLFSFFFFIKHGKSIYESLMLSAFVLGIVDVFLTLLGADNALFYIVLRNKVTGAEARIPVSLLWIILAKIAVMYLSRDLLPRFMHSTLGVKGYGEEEAGGYEQSTRNR